jgi:DNA-binding transcriptional LysR family regulator
VDDTLLSQAALREGLGVSILPCFMGDADPALVRYGGACPGWDLGLWVLLHPDLRRTTRVRMFRDYMSKALASQAEAFAGRA